MKELLANAGMKFIMYPELYGSPDFLVGKRVVIFCDSSFWHGRNWPSLKRKLASGSNPNYWVNHISDNRRRDREVTKALESMGYFVFRFWDTYILKDPDDCIRQLRAPALTSL
jgi:DNA mismatch endonuclease (patch repair protein)